MCDAVGLIHMPVVGGKAAIMGETGEVEVAAEGIGVAVYREEGARQVLLVMSWHIASIDLAL